LTAGLLIIGCILVINREINIGQFVASEIIIILIINAIEKLIFSLEVIYDVLASVDKIGMVTDLPIEKMKGMYIKDITQEEGLAINLRNLEYRYPGSSTKALSNINLSIAASERLCISGFNGSGKSSIINVLLGFLSSYKGTIEFNNVSLKELNKNSLLNQVGDNITYESIFEGSIEENITLGRKDIPIPDLLWAVEHCGLSKFVNNLPEGLQTHLVAGHKILPTHIAKKIILARGIVKKPKLLIIDEIILNIDTKEKLRLLKFLFDPEHKWTIIIISNNPYIMSLCNKVVLLKDGHVIEEGPYSLIQNKESIKEVSSSVVLEQ
ncbi:MAG: ATP-binding cassette domain-containing protein, partial [Cytophagaceae bacterium]